MEPPTVINNSNVIPENPLVVPEKIANPVYLSSDPSMPEKSYEELDSALNRLYLEKHAEYKTILAHHKTSILKVKEAACNDAVKEMKRPYNEQGQYTPFKEKK